MAFKNLETIDPIILSAIKEIRKSKIKLIIFFIESVAMNSCTYGKRSGPYNQDKAKETIQAAAENTSFIKPLKKPLMPKNAIKVIEELGFQMKGQFPKSIDSIETNKYEKIISMGCGVECPNLPISTDWGLDDPVGNDIDYYRNTRDLIMQKLEKLSQTQTDA